MAVKKITKKKPTSRSKKTSAKVSTDLDETKSEEKNINTEECKPQEQENIMNKTERFALNCVMVGIAFVSIASLISGWAQLSAIGIGVYGLFAVGSGSFLVSNAITGVKKLIPAATEAYDNCKKVAAAA